MKRAVVVLLSSMLLLSGCGQTKAEKVRGRFDAEDFESRQSEDVLPEMQKLSAEVTEADADTADASYDTPDETSDDTAYETSNETSDDTSAYEAINVIWGNSYPYAFGSDYVYIDSEGKIYFEGEMEEPLWRPSGACDETYTGKQFTEDELNEFLSIDMDDEDRQVEVLSKMGLRFGRSRFPY